MFIRMHSKQCMHGCEKLKSAQVALFVEFILCCFSHIALVGYHYIDQTNNFLIRFDFPVDGSILV